MTFSGFIQRTQTDSVDERIEIIGEELKLAIERNRPTILLVVYNSEYVRTDAEISLKNCLIERGEKVNNIYIDETSETNLISMLKEFITVEEHIFFTHISEVWQINILARIGNLKDIITHNKLRLVIWLTPNRLSDLARVAPDIWESRRRVIEIADMPNSDVMLQDAIESAWQGIGEFADPYEDTQERINFHETELTSLSQKSESASTRAKLLLTLGILNWRKGNLEKADELLQDALKRAFPLEDNWFEAECFNAIALVKFSQGKNNEAIEAYKQAIESAPEQIFVWNNLGNLCLKTQRNDEAMLAFQKTLKHNPKDSVAWNGLGAIYFRIGYIDDSVAAYQKAIEYAPLLATPWSGLGDAYASTGRELEAIGAYQKAIELNQDFITPWLRLAKIYSRQGRNRDAIKTYQRALVVNPKSYQTWNDLGLIFLTIGEFEKAMQAFLKAIELDQSFGQAYSNLALTYANQGMYLDAIQACQKSLQSFTENTDKITAWNHLAEFYRATNDYENALHAYQTIDKLKGLTVTNSNQLASDSPQVGTASLSKTTLDTSPILQPQTETEGKKIQTDSKNLKEQQITMGWINQPELKNDCESKSTTYSENFFWKVEEVNVSREPSTMNHQTKEEPMNNNEQTNPSLMLKAAPSVNISEESVLPNSVEIKPEVANSKNPEVWNQKGNIHFQNREFEKAISAYNKAIELNSSFGWPYSNLAHTYLILGKYAEAILLYQKSASLLEKNEEKAAAWNSLGNIYRHLNEYESALNAYQKADELDPQNIGQRAKIDLTNLEPNSRNAQVWFELGNLFFKSGSYKESANAFRKAIKIDPESGWAYSNLAMALVSQGEYSEAATLYLKSIELFNSDKDKSVSWNRLGNVYRKMNDEGKARKAYQTALILAKEKVNLLTRTRFSLLGNCYTN